MRTISFPPFRRKNISNTLSVRDQQVQGSGIRATLEQLLDHGHGARGAHELTAANLAGAGVTELDLLVVMRTGLFAVVDRESREIIRPAGQIISRVVTEKRTGAIGFVLEVTLTP